MIFRRPKSYSITLKRAHSLLGIPKDATSIAGETTARVGGGVAAPSRDRILEAFREAAKRHHPDLAARSTRESKTVAFRECHEARELLLDYYVRRAYVHPEVVESAKDIPRKDYADESLFSVWTTNRSFQIEAFARLAICLGLAVGTYYHDLHMPERRKQQIRRRDEGYHQFGPQPRY